MAYKQAFELLKSYSKKRLLATSYYNNYDVSVIGVISPATKPYKSSSLTIEDIVDSHNYEVQKELKAIDLSIFEALQLQEVCRGFEPGTDRLIVPLNETPEERYTRVLSWLELN